MAVERTLAIIKPDSVKKNVIGASILAIEEAGLRPVAMRRLRLSTQQAEAFYAVHSARPFFRDLVSFMCEGPIVVIALEGEGAIGRWRKLMGATDPAKAEPGTLRARFGTDIQNNGYHGSDAAETAMAEVSFFFPGCDIAP